MIFTGQFFPSQGSWLCLRCETCSHEKTSHRKAPGPTMRTTTRCLDVWIFRFCRWLKTPLLSQQRSQSCIFSGAWALFEIVHGDLSVRATAQKCLLSHFFPFSPPRPVGGVSIKHYLSLCGWRTLKIHPRSYITNSGRRWIYCTQRNTRLHCSVVRFYCWLRSCFIASPNKTCYF